MLHCLPVFCYLLQIFLILANVLAQGQLLRHKTHLQALSEFHILPVAVNTIVDELLLPAFATWCPYFLKLFPSEKLPALTVLLQLELQSDAQHRL